MTYIVYIFWTYFCLFLCLQTKNSGVKMSLIKDGTIKKQELKREIFLKKEHFHSSNNIAFHGWT